MTQIKKKELELYITKLEKENAKMRKISTRKGFYNMYFENLKTSKTHNEAFEKVNNQFLDLFGRKRYDDFFAFQRLTNFYNNA